VEKFRCEPAEDYYLIAGELVPYKRIDVAVKAFKKSGRKLRIVGDGPEFARLRGLASGNIEFWGRVSETQLHDMYARCHAFIMPGEEDFGITAVEAIASGKAVIALGRGGVLEIVPPEGAFLYSTPDEDSLDHAIRRFEAAEKEIPSTELQISAARFSEAEFDRKMREVLCTL
jgi:glycosyltransferase involved in cell wall biosynthesis